jgi:hypothetical protein
MTVNRYIFQSPYSNQIQVGKLDPSSQGDSSSISQEATNNTQTAKKETPSFENMETQKTQEVTAVEKSDVLLNLYA